MAGVKSLLNAAASDMEQTAKAKSKPKIKNEDNPKRLGGRPTNEARGLKRRKQYTLTLKEETYKLFLEKAYEEGSSFAKFMEKAALEYIKAHDKDEKQS